MLTRQKTAAELISTNLEQIPTRFARLLYLARCRSQGNRYEHYGMALTHTSEAVDACLREAHQQAWIEWLSLDLRQQYEDLSAYAADLNARRLVKAWTEAEPWHALAPASAPPHERDLFASDFRKILPLLLR